MHFVNSIIEVICYIKKSNLKIFNYHHIIVEFWVYESKNSEDPIKLSLISLQMEKLRMVLKAIHHLKHYAPTHDIKFYIKFDKYDLEKLVGHSSQSSLHSISKGSLAKSREFKDLESEEFIPDIFALRKNMMNKLDLSSPLIVEEPEELDNELDEIIPFVKSTQYKKTILTYFFRILGLIRYSILSYKSKRYDLYCLTIIYFFFIASYTVIISFFICTIAH